MQACPQADPRQLGGLLTLGQVVRLSCLSFPDPKVGMKLVAFLKGEAMRWDKWDMLRGGSKMVSLDKRHRASEVKGGEREPIALGLEHSSWHRKLHCPSEGEGRNGRNHVPGIAKGRDQGSFT